MLKEFDPYHKWLAIPPDKQPPNHYQLLGVEELESDPDVIDSAADQRMSHLRSCQSGKNAELSQRLLNEISTARITLLNAEKKAVYDEQLGLARQPTIESAGPNIEITSDHAFAADSTQFRQKKLPLPVIVAISTAALLVLGVVTFVIVGGRSGNGNLAENVSKSHQLEQAKSAVTTVETTDANRSVAVEAKVNTTNNKMSTVGHASQSVVRSLSGRQLCTIKMLFHVLFQKSIL